MHRPIKAIINAAALCFQENVKLNANDKQTAGIKNGAHGSKSGIVLSEMLFLWNALWWHVFRLFSLLTVFLYILPPSTTLLLFCFRFFLNEWMGWAAHDDPLGGGFSPLLPITVPIATHGSDHLNVPGLHFAFTSKYSFPFRIKPERTSHT